MFFLRNLSRLTFHVSRIAGWSFEHPPWCTPVVPDVQTSEILVRHRVFRSLLARITHESS